MNAHGFIHKLAFGLLLTLGMSGAANATPTQRDIRAVNRTYMAAHQHPAVVAANQQVAHAKLVYENAALKGTANQALYNATVIKADEARTKTLESVRIQTLGAPTAHAFENLSATEWAQGLKHGGTFTVR